MLDIKKNLIFSLEMEKWLILVVHLTLVLKKKMQYKCFISVWVMIMRT